MLGGPSAWGSHPLLSKTPAQKPLPFWSLSCLAFFPPDCAVTVSFRVNSPHRAVIVCLSPLTSTLQQGHSRLASSCLGQHCQHTAGHRVPSNISLAIEQINDESDYFILFPATVSSMTQYPRVLLYIAPSTVPGRWWVLKKYFLGPGENKCQHEPSLWLRILPLELWP